MAEILVRPDIMRRHHFQQPSPAYCHPTLPGVSRGGKFGSMSASGGSALCQSMRYADAWLYSGGRASLFGTVRGPSRSRPKLADDPYQAMRKSRLVLGTTSPVRKSILECQINPYTLIESSDSEGEKLKGNKEPGLRIGGQTVRVSKETPRSSVFQAHLRNQPVQTDKSHRPQHYATLNEKSRAISSSMLELKPKRPPRRSKTVSPPPPPPLPKSILKNSPNPPIPKPSHQQPRASFKEFKNRKKKQVQFKMSAEKLEMTEPEPVFEQKRKTPPPAPPPPLTVKSIQVSDGDSSDSSGSTKLRRSLSDLRASKQARATLFNDTMRLRQRSRSELSRSSVTFHSDEDAASVTPARPKEPPPPPPTTNPIPVPPPRQIFPFTKEQIAKLNRNRSPEEVIPTKILTLDPPPFPVENHYSNSENPYSNLILSDPEDNYVKVLVPSKNEENRTIVTVSESPEVRIQIKPEAERKTSVVIKEKEPIYNVIGSGTKVTISVNGYNEEKEQYDNVEKDDTPFRNSITINGDESGRTLLVVDHVSELRNILKGEETKAFSNSEPVHSLRKKSASHINCKMVTGIKEGSDVIGDSVREIEKIGSELGSDLSTLSDPYDASNPSSESSECKYDSTPSDVSDKGYEASNPSSESSEGKYDIVGHDDSTSDIFQEKDKLVDEVEIRLGLDFDAESNHYETIRDPIYEEISEEPPPLPLSPPPVVIEQVDELIPTKSIFEGATKYDILNYLAGAKRRGIVSEPSLIEEESICSMSPAHSRISSLDYSSRISQLSNASDSSEESGITSRSDISLLLNDQIRKGSAEIERNDSGVGSETSTSSRSRWQHLSSKEDQVLMCEDCDQIVETQVTDSGVLYTPLVCRKCGKRRAERREIITEIVETEEKYGRDLRILLDEFYRPMLVAGLLSQEQLGCIFLNSEELVDHSRQLAEKLRDGLEIAVEHGDEDLLTVNVGRIFLDATPMLSAFQSYCTRQGGAAMLLANLEKEKELLRIFLRVSQMENSVLRRMNLNSFLMVPVQRVTKYPLLLSRLYKVTPLHIVGREAIKEAQENISMHLEHINYLTKDISPTKIWRKISVINGKKFGADGDMINIKLRKIAVDVLEWKEDEVRFCAEGKLLYTQPQDNNWKRRATLKLNPILAVLLTLGKPNENYQVDMDEDVLFPKMTGIREATLLLLREKSGRYTLIREPLFLDRCIVCSEADFEDYFEIQELPTKDTYIFKAEDNESTKRWYKQLQYHAQGLGTWRKRRNALANIMINGMLLRT